MHNQKFTLTFIDFRHLQSYVFQTNELKQNIGASGLIEKATHEWLEEVLPKPNNAEKGLQTIKKDLIIEDPLTPRAAEVIYSGGGNAAILFRTEELAKEFTRNFTANLFLRAPGLQVAVGHIPDIDWAANGAFTNAWIHMQKVVMPARKEAIITPLPLIGLGVTAECVYTGLPAVERHPDKLNLISSEVKSKLGACEYANDRVKDAYSIPNYLFPDDFKYLGGEKGKSSYIAVVHIDGNSMGDRIEAHIRQGSSNRDTVKRLRTFSDELENRSSIAMQNTLDAIMALIYEDENGRLFIGKGDNAIPLKNGYLPIRPIIKGGDDITFICDGRLGISLAYQFLRKYEQPPLPDLIPAYACAGVSIVHSGFPFSRAYDLAEQLCQNAKNEGRKLKGKNLHSPSMLDWYPAISGLLGDYSSIHRSNYQVEDGNLNMRPIIISNLNGLLESWRSWENFIFQISAFREPEWKNRRNKVKDLRNSLRGGEIRTKQFTRLAGKLPEVNSLPPEVWEKGWHSAFRRCVYFDAVEILDLFTELK